MKTMHSIIFVLFLFFAYSTAQEQHTYGPVKENTFRSWVKQGSSGTPYDWVADHQVGTLSYNGVIWEARSINFWEWAYNNIPTQATVTSVTIKFKVSYTYTDNFHFTLHNIGYKYGASGINFYNECTTTNSIYEATLDMSTHYAYFNETFSSGPVFTAIQNAVTSGNYFFTIGIKLDPASMPVPTYLISGYSGGNHDQPAIDLTINYTTPNQYYQFVNKIEATQNYGALVIDNDKVNPVSSGTSRTFSFNTNHTVRTNELPFIVNWNSTGKTEKHHRFFELSPFDYSLNRSFTAKPAERSVQDANFLETKPATITTHLDGDVSGTGNIELKDPWRYYKDINNDWFQSNQYISYSTPFVIANNSSTSYGGVFLGQDLQTTYYSVNAPSPQTINGYSSYFLNWSGTNATFQIANAQQTGVVFTAANATATANYKAHLASNSTAALSGNNQRKLLRDVEGVYHLVYESSGKIFYTRSTDEGSTWAGETYLSGEMENYGLISRNPAIDLYYENGTFTWKPVVVWESRLADNSGYELAARRISGTTWAPQEYITNGYTITLASVNSVRKLPKIPRKIAHPKLTIC